MLKGFLDAIAFRVAEIVEAYLDAGFPRAESLTVDGGLSQSPYLMQLQADVLGIPLAVRPSPEATAIGAALMAGLAAGQVSIDEVRAATSARALIEPGDRGRAREDYAEWKKFASSARSSRSP